MMTSSQNMFTALPKEDDLKSVREKIKGLYTLVAIATAAGMQRDSLLEEAQGLANSRFNSAELQVIYHEAVREALVMQQNSQNSKRNNR